MGFCGGDNDESLAEENERLRAANDILLGQASDDYLIAYALGCTDGWRYAQEMLRAIIAMGEWARDVGYWDWRLEGDRWIAERRCQLLVAWQYVGGGWRWEVWDLDQNGDRPHYEGDAKTLGWAKQRAESNT